jgi:hypothetical protein
MVRVSTLMGGLVLAMTTYGSPLPQNEDPAPAPAESAVIESITLTDFAAPPEETATDVSITLTDFVAPPEETATDVSITLTDFAVPEETATDVSITLTGPPAAETSVDPLTLADSPDDTNTQPDTPELQEAIPSDLPFDLAMADSEATAMEAACDLDPREPKTWADSGAELRLIDYFQANGSGWYNSSFLEQDSNDVQTHGSMVSPDRSLIATKASLVAKETRLYAPSHRYRRTVTDKVSISHAF